MPHPSLTVRSAPQVLPGEASFLNSILGSGYTDLGISSGLSAFAVYAQRQLTTVKRELRAQDNTSIDLAGPIDDVEEPALEVAAQFLTILKDLPANKFTIDEVVKKYISLATNSSPSPEYRYCCTQTVFHAIALGTMLYKVGRESSLSCFQVHTGPAQMRRVELSMAQRPVIALLRSLGSLQTSLLAAPRLAGYSGPVTNGPDVLNVTNLSLSALISIGKISLIWVDSLDQHLEFDFNQRQLGVFRFPSFLVANHHCESQSFLNWLIQGSGIESKSQRSSIIDIESSILKPFVQETISTYRFIFGQNKASRRCFWRKLRPAICKDGCYDPLLDEICGMRDKKFHLHRPDLMALVEGRGSVFATSELPKFGSRLKIVQEHVEKHRPKRLTDLYRDRRDQEKFFTFWAVIGFGGVAVIIGLIQTLLNAAQLAIAYQQWRSPIRRGDSRL